MESNLSDEILYYPNFAVNKKYNFSYRKITGSPMHLLFLRISNTCIGIIYMLSSVFDFKK